MNIGNDLFRDFISIARPERKSAFLIPEFDSFDIKLDSEDFQGIWSTYVLTLFTYSQRYVPTGVGTLNGDHLVFVDLKTRFDI